MTHDAPDGVSQYAAILSVTNPLREPVVQAAVEALQLPPGSRGLDAGCGIGLQAILLARAVGAGGHVTGVDISPQLLVHARARVAAASTTARTAFCAGDVRVLPFDDATFDWAWSMDCVGYLPLEPVALVRELARVVRPGGQVAIAAWSSERLLPGYPLLEARLSATGAGLAPFVAGEAPERHFARGLAWLREAGLHQLRAWTFSGGAQGPLSGALRAALAALLEMRWQGAQQELPAGDWALYQALSTPDSAQYLLNKPDYYAFFTYSMFSGVA